MPARKYSNNNSKGTTTAAPGGRSGTSPKGRSSGDDEEKKTQQRQPDRRGVKQQKELVEPDDSAPLSSEDEMNVPNDVDSSDSGDDDDHDDDDDQESEEEEEMVATKNRKNAGFTDENAKWLKPKTATNQLLESDDDDDSDGDDDDEDEDGDDDNNVDESDDDDEDEMLDIEKEAAMVDDEMQIEQEEAEAEMKRTIADHTAIYHLPTPAELEKDGDRVVPPTEIRSHIESILEVLADFKTRREVGRSRQEYMDALSGFMAELYGYLPELVEYFLTMFSPAECLEFIDASDKPRPLVIRTNTIKTRRKDLAAALIKRGVSLDPLAAWSKVGLKIVESPVPVGATPEYLSGMYMLQSAASMCPVLALAPQPQERVLDMSAAPGGKTSYIAQLMRNTGSIIANDLKPERQKATVANMHRLGVKNVIACASDGRKLGHMFKNRFDRVLLDAPCSGLGVISRDPSVKVQRTIADIKQCAHLQKELLLAAIDTLKYKGTTGGIMVYSTCSVSVYENEEVVQYALQKRDIQIIETGLDFGTAGFTRYQQKRFHPSMAHTKRFYPHTVNMDGFFVCKIKKLSDNRPNVTIEESEAADVGVVNSETSGTVVANLEEEVADDKATEKGDKNTDKAPRPKKNARVSLPPKLGAVGVAKKKTNAKVTKPRRPKQSDPSKGTSS